MVPPLVELCLLKLIDNLHLLGDVGDVEDAFLEQLLPHCSEQQLRAIEDNTKKDLTELTDNLWKQCYRRKNGEEAVAKAEKRMSRAEVTYTWREIFDARCQVDEQRTQEGASRIQELYQQHEKEKGTRKIQVLESFPAKRRAGAGARPMGGRGGSFIKRPPAMSAVQRLREQHLRSQRAQGVKPHPSSSSRPASTYGSSSVGGLKRSLPTLPSNGSSQKKPFARR